MKHFLVFCSLLLLVSTTIYSKTPVSRTDSIKCALLYQRKNYPVSQYRDVYKNFMQDFYGPGHLLNDTASSARYLRQELETTEKFDGPDFEPTGFQGNFYRVNLSLIKNGTIPYPIFFDAFVESVQGIVPPAPEIWMKIWQEIDDEIRATGWTFPNEDQDRQDLADQFEKGDYIAHHSDIYNRTVNFHYRIISKEKFEDIILPLVNERNNSRQ